MNPCTLPNKRFRPPPRLQPGAVQEDRTSQAGQNGTKWYRYSRFSPLTALPKADSHSKWEKLGKYGKSREKFCPIIPTLTRRSGQPMPTRQPTPPEKRSEMLGNKRLYENFRLPAAAAEPSYILPCPTFGPKRKGAFLDAPSAHPID